MPADAESPSPIAVEVGDGLPAKPGFRRQGRSAEGVAELTLRLRAPGRFGELLGVPFPRTPDRKVQLGR